MYKEAIANYDKVLELNKDDFSPWVNKCAALIMIGKFQDALINCEKAIALKSEHPLAYFNKAAIYCLLHDKENSISSLKQAFEKGILHFYPIEKIRTMQRFYYIRNDPRFEDLLKLYEKNDL
jgi:tetratricopeptide (TPR) repeat protein